MARTTPAGRGARTSKNVLMLIGGTYHPFEACAEIARKFLAASGRYELTVTEDRNVLAGPLKKFDAVIIYTCGGKLSAGQEAGLVKYVTDGGGLVAVHAANVISDDNKDYIALIGSRFDTHPRDPLHIDVKITDASHPATTRLSDFSVVEELYAMKNLAPDIRVLATTAYKSADMPVMYCRQAGKGRVFYTSLGHSTRHWELSSFQRSLLHGLDWAAGTQPLRTGPIRCAILGYGPSFNMGRHHAKLINATEGLTAIGACDIDPARIKAARDDFPSFRTWPNADKMLADPDVDLVVSILPHNIHAEYAVKCLKAGRHVITEKPFCVTLKEADAMIAAAKAKGVMLTCYHNRRWDGDFCTIRRMIRQGLIGEVFEISCGFADYQKPGRWWRSDKAISGGNLYDWGAHFTDWVLQLIPEKIASIQGFFQKKVWAQATNEDHTQAIIRFANGAMADIVFSSISAAPRPRWRILGTAGAILDDRTVEKGCQVMTYENGQIVQRQVKWDAGISDEYYHNIADHLLLGDELMIKPQEARRIISVIEYAERSSKAGTSMPIPGEA